MFENLTSTTAKTDKRITYSLGTKTKIVQFCAEHGLSKRAFDAHLVHQLMIELDWCTHDAEVCAGLATRLIRFIEANVCAEKLPMAIKAEPLSAARNSVPFRVTWAAHTLSWSEPGFEFTHASHVPQQGPPDFEHGRVYTRAYVSTTALSEAVGEIHAGFRTLVPAPATTSQEAANPQIIFRMPDHIDAFLGDISAFCKDKNGSPMCKDGFIATLEHSRARAQIVNYLRAALKPTGASDANARFKADNEKLRLQVEELTEALDECIQAAERATAEANGRSEMLMRSASIAESKAQLAEGKAKQAESEMQKMQKMQGNFQQLQGEMQKVQKQKEEAEARANILANSLKALQAQTAQEGIGRKEVGTGDGGDFFSFAHGRADSAYGGNGNEGRERVEDGDESSIGEGGMSKLQAIKEKLKNMKAAKA
ncbi:hypothetical protein Tdes44962_MAKER08140 [Teratosphaeria destructans]|uniref:Uncharacterized protein n=1 Tax=Teratosphaeria destructans TaxID=418781 RepID=A0A9W7W4U6_9PEZI|nr:hypothetical protein Tdes44962_MAKER08140 [Teratosphaeria destructans]